MATALELTERMLAGDRIALAKLMTLVENRDPATVAVMSRIEPRCGRAYTIGITGPPGAGKSTLVDRLVGQLRADSRSVGILAIDPSSPFSGGAVLGDRIRMQSHYLDDQVFIRSLSTRGTHGGLARATRHLVRLFDAFGKDVVIIETVGVGQTELDVMRVAETTVVVLVPEAGDTVQTMKAGLLEIADIFVVNKADREGALRLKTELDMMLQLRPPAEWSVPVLLTTATDGAGVQELLATILRHREVRRGRAAVGAESAFQREEFINALRDEIVRRVDANVTNGRFQPVLDRIARGELDPYGAALEIMMDADAVRALIVGVDRDRDDT